MNAFLFIDELVVGAFERYIADPLSRVFRRNCYWFASMCSLLTAMTATINRLAFPSDNSVLFVFYILNMLMFCYAAWMFDRWEKMVDASSQSICMSPFRVMPLAWLLRLILVFNHVPAFLTMTIVFISAMVGRTALGIPWWAAANLYIDNLVFPAVIFFASCTVKKPPPEKKKEEAVDGVTETT